MIEIIDNHSVRVDLLTKGPVLDAGARGFVFSMWFAERGYDVYGLDPSPDIEGAPLMMRFFAKRALVGRSLPRDMYLQLGSDPNAWNVQSGKAQESVAIQTMNLNDLPAFHWDLIKLNIEGSEYDILDEIEGPIARQIVFSFHEHTDRARGREECDRIINKLRQWYGIYNQVWEKRYGCRENYWDVLCIEKGIE